MDRLHRDALQQTLDSESPRRAVLGRLSAVVASGDARDGGAVYNVADDEPCTTNELVAEAVKSLGVKEPAPNEAIPCWAGKMKRGDWFTCKKGEVIDLDILIGEIPGSLFGAWLFIEKQGATYPTFTDPKSGQRFPILPVFQVKSKKTPVPTGGNTIPFTVDAAPWTCHP